MTNKVTLPPISDILFSVEAPARFPHKLHAPPVPQAPHPQHYLYPQHFPQHMYQPRPARQPQPLPHYAAEPALQAPSPQLALMTPRRHSETLASLEEPPLPVSKLATPEMRQRVRTRNNLPKETTYILLKWLNEHLKHPYPNSFEKTQLMMTTGLSQQQLSNWFINARRRKIKALRQRK